MKIFLLFFPVILLAQTPLPNSSPGTGTGGTVTSVAGTSPINSSGGSTPTISIDPPSSGTGTPGGVASITTASGAINTVETSIVSFTIPANTIKAGTVYRITAYGTCTSTVSNTSTMRVRFGSTGTSSDTAIGQSTPTSQTSGTNVPFKQEFLVTFQSTTVSEVSGSLINSGTTGVSNIAVSLGAPTNSTGLTTSSNEVIQFSYISAASTTTSTFQNAVIELVKP